MGEIIKTFNEQRQPQIANERRISYFGDRIKNKNKIILGTHKRALETDITFALMVEIQRNILGDDVTDKFFHHLCELREFYAIQPNTFDADPRINNAIFGLTVSKGGYPTGEDFNAMMIACEKDAIQPRTLDYKFHCVVSESKNTSMGIQLFQEWSKDDEGQELIRLLKQEMIRNHPLALSQQFSKSFISKYIQISRATINLNTKIAHNRYKARTEGRRLEAKGMSHNLKLIVSN